MLIDMSTNKLKQSLNSARQMVNSSVSAVRERLNSISAPNINLSRLRSSLQQSTAATTQATGRMRNELGQFVAGPVRSEGFLGSLNRLKLMTIVSVTAITAALGFSLNEGLKGAANKVAFETLAGKDAGDKLFGDLTKFAQDSIFGKEVYDMGKQMLAFGATTKSVMPTIQMLGDVSMGDKERLGQLVLVFNQVRSAGRLMGQDLLQLINAGFNPLQKIHEKTGESMISLKKKMEDGKISFDMVNKTFIEATSAGGRFYKMTDRIAATEFGQWEAIKGQVEGIALAFGTALLPAIGSALSAIAPALDIVPALLASITPAISDLIRLLVPILQLAGMLAKVIMSALAPVINKVANIITSILSPALKFISENLEVMAWGIGAAAVAWGLFNISTITAAISTGVWTAAQWLLNIALNANPIGLIITAIGALVAAIVWVVKNTEGWGDAWKALKKTLAILWYQMGLDWDELKDKFSYGFTYVLLQFKDFGEHITGIIENIKNAWDLAWTGNFSSAKDALVADIKTEASKQLEALEAQRNFQKALYEERSNKNLVDVADAWKNVNIRVKTKKTDTSLTDKKVDMVGGTDPTIKEGTGAGAASKVTGAASQVRNISISFGSYIKGDIITQNKQIQNMSKDELDRWLREHLLRLIQSVEGAY